MSDPLSGRTVAFLMSNSGVEQAELVKPRDGVTHAGATVVLLAPEKGTIQAFNHDVEKADTFQADKAVKDTDPDAYDLLVLPGGTTNPDQLRLDTDAVDFVRQFVATGKPVAAICHGPWTLVEAGVVEGKTLTSWPSLRTDITNAGGDWRDEEVFVCPMNGWRLITSRKPDDLPAFTKAIVDTLSS
ncbi:type 1 glutamine amidotransferase domain-containing protein [Mangrovihabitans endophyticus]|uniref:Peptidase C56 PfpI n=1 Tax=Mangrovihabitans endophyticus TaxID=1751298 RepID=A0A8J3C5B7_9ACTN|nr:type 1 glutamine amidotransferase domain-containing protein [Mangrovihabitans endophyticus]GGL11663.1 peptidase C56 PfpI [Mangrovihabitans endophyticus]